MRIKSVTSLLVILSLSLIIVDVEAGWKFWKKKDKDKDATTTTLAPDAANPELTIANAAPGTTSTTAKPPSSRGNVGPAVLGAGDPGLAIGVSSTGGKIKENARPNKPNPGTEVGLDFPSSKPGNPAIGGNTGQGYRDWATDLAGVGDPGRKPPKLPSEGPALGGGDSRPASYPGNTPKPSTPGARPVSGPGGAPVQPTSPGAKPSTVPAGIPAPQPQPQPQPRPQQPQPQQPQPQPRPQQPQPQPRPQQPQPQSPGAKPSPIPGQPEPFPSLPGAGGNQVSTLNVGPLKPGGTSPPSPTPRPGSPGSPGKSWADVAGGGSRPNSPTPAPRPGSPSQSGYPNQPGQTQPKPQVPVQPWQSKPSTGGVAGGALAGGALAGGALAGAAAAGAASTTKYSSNPTYSKGNTITDEDLEKLSEALYIKDNNNANKYITLNLQKQTTSSSTADDAPQPLFTVNAQAYQIPTVQRVISIYDNYKPETNVNEHISPLQRQEESMLVDTFLSTNVMSAAMRFLADKGKIRKDYYEYKDTLRKIWFNLFSRGQGKIGSSGFEHVFMSELKVTQTGTEVVGLHNWIYYSKEESGGRADYNGYLKKVDLGDKASIVKIRTKYSGHDKPVTTVFVGTSPELEMALYTVCFYARPDGNCPVSMGGTKFNIVTYKFKYRGNDLIGTAYPDI